MDADKAEPKPSSDDEFQELLRCYDLPAIEDLGSGDDLLDDEVAHIGMVGQVFKVGTRATSAQDGDEAEDSDTDESQNLRQIIYRKDEQIASMQEKLEELMKNMSAMTAQIEEFRKVSSTGRNDTTNTQGSKDRIPTEGRIGQPVVNKEQLDQLVQQSIKAALAADKQDGIVKTGRPYPKEYDSVPFPPNFATPRFKMFDGVGNPKQHLAQFRANCCNAKGSDALLLQLFVTSLSGVAFEWYSELPNDIITTFAEMEELFIKRFISAYQKITVGDLVHERKKALESLPDYIIRYRNLSMKCDPPIGEEQAVDILLKNIDGPIAPHLIGHEIRTFQVLLSKVIKLQAVIPDALPPQKETSSFNREKRFRSTNGQPFHKKSEVAMTAVEERGKGVAVTEDASRLPRPSYRSMEERRNKKYSFRRDSVRTLFDLMSTNGLQLPEMKRPEQAGRTDHPSYCPYHRHLGHTLEDCWSFKDLVEDYHQKKQIVIAKKYLLAEPSIHMVQHIEEDPTLASYGGAPLEQTGWEVAMSNSSRKLFKRLEKLTTAQLSKESKGTKQNHKGTPPATAAAAIAPSPTYESVGKERVINVKEKGKKPLRKMTLKEFLSSPNVTPKLNEMKFDSEYMMCHPMYMVHEDGQLTVDDDQSEETSEVESPKGDFIAPLGFHLGSESELEDDDDKTKPEDIRKELGPEPEPEEIKEV